MSIPNQIVSLDLETSGLNPLENAILSIGMVHPASGAEFYMEVSHGSLTVEPGAMRVNRLDLTQLDQITDTRKPIGIVDNKARDWLAALGEGRKTALGWNVGGFDLQFIKEWMPQVMSQFSYRTVDLSGVCMARDITRGVPLGTTKEAYKTNDARLHNALFDAQDAVRVLKEVTIRDLRAPQT